MHDNQIETTADLLRRLLAAQFPRWSDLPIQPVQESGTDHALYRLGDGLVARLPIIDWAVDQAESDHRWLPVLAPHLPLPIPVPVALGRPGEGYPWPWLVVPWIAGETPNGDNLDLTSAAVIDFSGLGLGDPAADLAPAWNLFEDGARTIFRDTIGYDDATWARGKGWVLAPALQGLRYYRKTRPEFVVAARHRIDAVLADRADH